MDAFMIWSIPLVFFLCVAAVLALRKRWQNALTATLAAGISLALMGWSGEAHTSSVLRVTLQACESRIQELERQLSDPEEEATGPRSGPEQRADH